jgi:hypothetical protein
VSCLYPTFPRPPILTLHYPVTLSSVIVERSLLTNPFLIILSWDEVFVEGDLETRKGK